MAIPCGSCGCPVDDEATLADVMTMREQGHQISPLCLVCTDLAQIEPSTCVYCQCPVEDDTRCCQVCMEMWCVIEDAIEKSPYWEQIQIREYLQGYMEGL